MAKDTKASLVESRFKFSSEHQQSIFDDFARYHNLWRSKIVDQANYPWDYALFNPMVFSTIRAFVARCASGNLGVDLQAWNEEERPKTRINRSLLQWEFDEVQFFLIVARWVFATALYGRGFVGTGWKFEKERVIQEEDDRGQVRRSFPIKPKVNRADLENIRTVDIFVANRNIPDLQKQPWVVRRMHRTIPQLIAENVSRGGSEKEGPYRNLAKLKEEDWFVRQIEYGADVQGATEDGKKSDKWKGGVLEILQLQDKETGRVMEKVRGHDDFLLRDEENPFYHGDYDIVDLAFFPEDDEFWSSGAVMPIEDLQFAINSTLNQYMSNASQQLNNMWIQKDGARPIPDWEFISRPNGVIHGDVEPVTHPDITNTALSMMNTLEDKLTRTTGITDQLSMGQPATNVDTAAGQQLQQENLDVNIKLFMTLLEQTGIKRVARHFLALNKQFITDEQVIKIVGRHGYSHASIKPDEVSASFDPIVIPNSMMAKNPLIRAQNLQAILDRAEKTQKVKVNTAPVWKELIDTMGLTDMDEIVPDDIDEAMEENELLKKNVPVECEPNDNHDAHVMVHQYPIVAGDLDQATVQRFVDHIKAHKMWKLAADPELLDKMAHGGQPTPTNPEDLVTPAPPPTPGMPQMPMMPQGMMPGVPAGPQQNVPVDIDGLIDQVAAEVEGAANPLPGVPVEGGIAGV